MTRAQLEAQIADYLDGILPEADAAEFEKYLPLYPDLTEFVGDAREGMRLLDRLDAPQPPFALYARIALSIEEAQRQARREKRNTGWPLKLATFFATVLQPRLVMGMAMTVLSISMIGQLTGTRIHQITPADLKPATVWSSIEYRAQRIWDRAEKYYESLRVIYEMRLRVREWRAELERERGRAASQQEDPDAETAPENVEPATTKRPESNERIPKAGQK